MNYLSGHSVVEVLVFKVLEKEELSFSCHSIVIQLLFGLWGLGLGIWGLGLRIFETMKR